MLKLLKHDIKDSYLEIVVINGILIGLSVFAIVSQKLELTILLVASMTAWAITFSAAFFVVLFSIINSFHKKLFTDYGYLTLTTPVSLDKILLSKIIVNMMWGVLTAFSAVMSIFFVIYSIASPTGLFLYLAETFTEYPLETFQIILLMLLSLLNIITTLVFVLVLVNTGRMKKHKFLKGILIYLAIHIATSAITSGFGLNVMFIFSGSLNKATSYLLSVFMSLGWSAVFYFAARQIMTRRLELE